MRLRHPKAAAATIAVVGLIAFTGTSTFSAVAAPSTAHPDDWCASSGGPKSSAPCVVAVSQDGTAIGADDATWTASVLSYPVSGDHESQWSIADSTAGGSYATMGAAQATHLWSITLRLDVDPRAISAYADQLQTSVTDNGDGTWNVTMTGYPVTTGVNDECTVSSWPWSCPTEAGQNVTIFQGQADDMAYTNSPAPAADYAGTREWTNVEDSELPPEVSGDPLQITEPLANSHELAGGGLFHGFFHAILPNPFLVDMGIDDPSTIDAGSISTSIASGTVTVTPGPTSVQIDVTGITFSPHRLHIKRGTITPTRPRITKGKRRSHSVTLSFTKARPRGSHIRHYEARCRASGQPTRLATARRSPIVVRHLAGVGYKCQVRAKAKAGYGAWSKKHSVRA
jgi:hypothetical protein